MKPMQPLFPVYIFWTNHCNCFKIIWRIVFILTLWNSCLIFSPLSQKICFFSAVEPSCLTLERVHPNGKMCVDLFIKAHVGALKVEVRYSRNALWCCWDWMGWPEGNTAQCLLVQRRSRWCWEGLIYSFNCLCKIGFYYHYEVTTDMDPVVYVLSWKCWCKERYRMLLSHWLAVSTLSTVTRSNITMMSGPNRLSFMVVTLP